MRLLTVLVVCVAVACQTGPVRAPSSETQELTAVLRAALDFLERNSEAKLTLVADDELSSKELAALGQVRSFIRQSQVPTSPDEALPANYLIVEAVEVHGDKGRFEGLLGPVPRNPPGKEDRILLACGTDYGLGLVKADSGWTVRIINTGAC